MGAGFEDEVVLRLNEDGTFDPYTTSLEEEKDSTTTNSDDKDDCPEDLHHLLGWGGSWRYQDYTLLLASARPKTLKNLFTKRDTVFRGIPEAIVTPTLEEPGESQIEESGGASTATEQDMDISLCIPQGQISVGKFMYGQKHPMFFDEPMLFKPSNRGFVKMNQLLGQLNAVQKQNPDETNQPEPKFHASDFYDKVFYLATAEHPVEERYIEEDKHCDPDRNPLWDVRALEVNFFANNTFEAVSTEKTLRGKFGICGPEGDQVWMQVSIFGAGRSVSGSVFSEGRFVGQQDKRGYVGNIQAYPNKEDETIFHVYGHYFDGQPDIDNLQQYPTAGTFVLHEVELFYDDQDDDEDDYSFNDPWGGEEDAFL